MSFETFFRAVSYLAVFCGLLSLWVSGTFGAAAPLLFILTLLAAWFLEDTKWQISEKLGTALIVLALPGFLVGWRLEWFSLSATDTAIAGVLARLILSLSAIKLLQRKSSRDWVFLYLMSFFEVMLGAGLSMSGLYLLSFVSYVLVVVCAIITFEIRKTALEADKKSIALRPKFRFRVGRLPVTAAILIGFISVLAVPLFFMLPRVGGAGLGGSRGERSKSGFSEKVSLGGSGSIEQSDAIVMRVTLDESSNYDDLYFRGIALDTFDNRVWTRSISKEIFEKGERDTIQVDYASSRIDRSIQTVYLEPLLETPVLFALPRALVVQGNFQFLYKDNYGSISFLPTSERISYKVLSDRSTPPVDRLRSDIRTYQARTRNYLQLPVEMDPRIGELAQRITAGMSNRYDRAKAVETYLRTNIEYTLERRADGPEPLADFLFNVKAGHCEYFATAMAVMLRTQGIATRIVNGFHGGDFNDAADVTIVRERNAHSWVEVYFPTEDSWVTFDPTPSLAQSSGGINGGLTGAFRKYADALETFWIQYFVAFDDQGQRSLARSLRSGISDFQVSGAVYAGAIRDVLTSWWYEVRQAEGGTAMMAAIAKGLGRLIGTVVIVFFGIRSLKWVSRWRIWSRLRRRPSHVGIVEFYERMQAILAEQGLHRQPSQTPVEFAEVLSIPEVMRITEIYNGVRFGQRDISADQSARIEQWLSTMKSSNTTA